MNFVNLTPHVLNVVDDNGNLVLSVQPSGQVARVTAQATVVGNVGGVDVVRTTFGDVVDLPSPQPNTVYPIFRREDSHFNEAKRSKWEMNRLNYILLKII